MEGNFLGTDATERERGGGGCCRPGIDRRTFLAAAAALGARFDLPAIAGPFGRLGLATAQHHRTQQGQEARGSSHSAGTA